MQLLLVVSAVLSLLANVSNASDFRLFKRQSSDYPALDIPGPTPRKEWVDAYQRAKAAGLIPNIQPSVKLPSGLVQYPESVNPLDPNVCNWLLGCKSPNDINDAPDGMMGISFDDGPQGGTTELLKFLGSVNQTATHFMIGSRILSNPDAFKATVAKGDHIAVHTWSHPQMTTMTDLQVLGEIGWTSQVIFDLGGGRLPAFWRPPYGDTDNRVRAIAKHVFGLQTVIWNHDTEDWCVSPDDVDICANRGPANQAAITALLKDFAKLPKSPGLVILEHEVTLHSVRGFADAWSAIKAAGWDTRPIAGLFNKPWYQNAFGAFDHPNDVTTVLNASQSLNGLQPSIVNNASQSVDPPKLGSQNTSSMTNASSVRNTTSAQNTSSAIKTTNTNTNANLTNHAPSIFVNTSSAGPASETSGTTRLNCGFWNTIPFLFVIFTLV